MVQTISYLQNNLLTEAKTETEARNDTEGDKTLTATYTDERELEKADSLLQTLPQETPEDIAFYDFFAAYIDELQSNTALLPYDGKAPSQAALQIQNMAADTELHSNTGLLAQTVLASQQNLLYSRNPKDIAYETIKIKQVGPSIKFVPNPAQNSIQLFFDIIETVGQICIYTAIGVKVATLSVSHSYTCINTSQLANGVYFCEFSTGNGTRIVGKFTILH